MSKTKSLLIVSDTNDRILMKIKESEIWTLPSVENEGITEIDKRALALRYDCHEDDICPFTTYMFDGDKISVYYLSRDVHETHPLKRREQTYFMFVSALVNVNIDMNLKDVILDYLRTRGHGE